MSISQIAQFLTGIPKNVSQPTHYFMYGNQFLMEDFQQHIVDTTILPIAFLPGWNWHMNGHRKPNIRPVYKDLNGEIQAPVMVSTPKFDPRSGRNGTFGLIFQLTPELKVLLKKKHEAGKLPMARAVHVVVKAQDGSILKTGVINALVYWDPLFTADGLPFDNWANEGEIEKWKGGLTVLRKLGALDEWIVAIVRRMSGEEVNPESLFLPPVPRVRPHTNGQQVQRVWGVHQQQILQNSSPQLPRHVANSTNLQHPRFSSPILAAPPTSSPQLLAANDQHHSSDQQRTEASRQLPAKPAPNAEQIMVIKARQEENRLRGQQQQAAAEEKKLSAQAPMEEQGQAQTMPSNSQPIPATQSQGEEQRHPQVHKQAATEQMNTLAQAQMGEQKRAMITSGSGQPNTASQGQIEEQRHQQTNQQAIAHPDPVTQTRNQQQRQDLIMFQQQVAQRFALEKQQFETQKGAPINQQDGAQLYSRVQAHMDFQRRVHIYRQTIALHQSAARYHTETQNGRPLTQEEATQINRNVFAVMEQRRRDQIQLEMQRRAEQSQQQSVQQPQNKMPQRALMYQQPISQHQAAYQHQLEMQRRAENQQPISQYQSPIRRQAEGDTPMDQPTNSQQISPIRRPAEEQRQAQMHPHSISPHDPVMQAQMSPQNPHPSSATHGRTESQSAEHNSMIQCQIGRDGKAMPSKLIAQNNTTDKHGLVDNGMGMAHAQYSPTHQARMGHDGPQNANNKRKAESEDRLMEELKSMKKDGHTGGEKLLAE